MTLADPTKDLPKTQWALTRERDRCKRRIDYLAVKRRLSKDQRAERDVLWQRLAQVEIRLRTAA